MFDIFDIISESKDLQTLTSQNKMAVPLMIVSEIAKEMKEKYTHGSFLREFVGWFLIKINV